MGLKLPNLLIVGFQKCGSSSLFDMLSQHTQIAGTSPKETYFFTDSSYDNFNRDSYYGMKTDAFKTFIEHKDLGNAQYLMEGSVCNFYQATALQYAVDKPDVKVIFIMRDPIDRFISVFKYFGSDGLHLKAGTSIDQYYQQILDETIENELLKYGVEHGKYHKYIAQWENAIGKNRIMITSLRALQVDAQQTMNTLCDFLNIDKVTASTLIHKNKTKMVKRPHLHAFLSNWVGGLGLRHTWLVKLYSQWNSGERKIELSDRTREKLKQEYIEEYTRYNHLF